MSEKHSSIWVVLQDDPHGSYDGYTDRLLGIFSTNDKAEVYRKQVIEYLGEWAIDEIVIRKKEIDSGKEIYTKNSNKKAGQHN